jgi:hypothetical protein
VKANPADEPVRAEGCLETSLGSLPTAYLKGCPAGIRLRNPQAEVDGDVACVVEEDVLAVEESEGHVAEI